MNKQQYLSATAKYIQALPSAKKSNDTVKSYSKVLRQFGEYIKDEEITPATVIEWRTSLYGHVSNNTIANYLTVLHTFFASAERLGLVAENPVLEQEIPEEQQREYDLLNSDEIDLLLNSDVPTNLDSRMQARNQAIVVLLLQTGIRNSELRNLRVKDLDFATCTITIRRGKGDKRRVVSFPPKARELVKAYLNSGIRPQCATDSDWLFGTDADKHGHSTNGQIWKQFSSQGLCRLIRCYTKNGCDHSVKTHTLRHAAASNWDDKGVPMRDIQRNLGHSSMTTTEQIYVSILNNKKSALKVNDALANT